MRITEFSIPLRSTSPDYGAVAVQAALSGALEDWRRGGAQPFVSARSLVLTAAGRVADAALRRRMHIRTKADPALQLPAEQVVRLQLIAEALLANAVQHAHPSGVIGQIDLRCEADADGRVVLEVADDGVGLPERFTIHEHGGGGLALVAALARQLDANVQLKSGACGLQVEVWMPPSVSSAK
jgi:two-component sensor histidine kinase